VHGEGGQATVEWIALVLLAALVLGAAAALSRAAEDRSLGELVAKRIARAPSGVPSEGSGRAFAPGGSAGTRPAPAASGAAHGRSAGARGAPAAGVPGLGPSPPPTAASAPRAGEAFPQLRGVGQVARHAWVVCLGYRRWRHELDSPLAPNEALPLGDALGIVNDCLNPHDYLLAD
jgi:hypothetical protein